MGRDIRGGRTAERAEAVGASANELGIRIGMPALRGYVPSHTVPIPILFRRHAFLFSNPIPILRRSYVYEFACHMGRSRLASSFITRGGFPFMAAIAKACGAIESVVKCTVLADC